MSSFKSMISHNDEYYQTGVSCEFQKSLVFCDEWNQTCGLRQHSHSSNYFPFSMH